jgi:hypothetical protein
MPTLQESIDALDRMIDGQASKPELRSQIAFIGREVAALEADYSHLSQDHATLQEAQLARDDDVAVENRHKVGVTLTNGVTKYYDADTYKILPNEREPRMVEFRKTDKAAHTYQEVAHAKWSDVSEVHKPSA